MEVKKISASSIKCFKKCEFAYFLEYVAGIRSEGNYKTVTGNVVHSLLEEYALGNTDYVSLLPRYFIEHRLDYHCRKEDKSFADAVNNCLELTETVLNRKNNPILTDTILGVEKEFKMLIENIPSIGYIDLVKLINDSVVEVRDWKTGNFIQTYEQVHDDPQAQIYDIAMKEMYPDKDIMITLDYIKGMPVTVVYTDEERSNNKIWIRNLVSEIKRIKTPKRRRDDWMCAKMCIGREKCNTLWNQFVMKDFKVENKPEVEITEGDD